MKKRIEKYIAKQAPVKVYLADEDGTTLSNFNGIIVEQNPQFILMIAMHDFSYDGLIVARKSDISEIQYSDHEVFIDSILKKEGIKARLIERRNQVPFQLGSFPEMFESLKDSGKCITVECKYDNKGVFLLGPVVALKQKKIRLDYINTNGEFDLKPVSAKFKDITFFCIDDQYADLVLKYSKRVE